MGNHCAQAARAPGLWPETRDGQESGLVGQAPGDFLRRGGRGACVDRPRYWRPPFRILAASQRSGRRGACVAGMQSVGGMQIALRPTGFDL